MTDDRRDSERSTDDEFDALRHARFGELPGRVQPADLIETAETDPAHDEPEQPPVRREWG